MKKLIPGVNDLETLFPDVAKEWHPTKNNGSNPCSCFPKSESYKWWIGPCGHEWEAKIKERTNGYGCPYCAGKRVLVGFNDFASKHPAEALEWHPTKNCPLRPEEFTEFSNEMAWWLCKECGYSWKSSFNKRAIGRGCPICAHKRTSQKLIERASKHGNDFLTMLPEIAEEWHPIKNSNKQPSDFSVSSNQEVWWLCRICGHEWEASLNKRAHGRGCPQCAFAFKTSEPEQAVFFYVKKYFPDAVNSWEATWLSGQSIDVFIPSLNLAIEYDGGFFHDDAQKERDERKSQILLSHGVQLVRIRETSAIKIEDGSHQIPCSKYDEDLVPLVLPLNSLFKFINETYSTNILPDIDIERDYPKITELFLQRKKKSSLAANYPHLAAQWHPTKNGLLTPAHVPLGSKKPVWWLCEKHHEWKATVNSRVRGNGCPVCAGKTVLAGFNDLATTHPEIAVQWNYSKNHDLTPQMITAGTPRKVWWIGPCGHEWEASVQPRTKKGVGCPYCRIKHKVNRE